MMKKTSKNWYREYLDWGGISSIVEPDGWSPRAGWESFYKEKITAEEFMERVRCSSMCYEKNIWDMSDIEYYFTVVVREEP